MGCGIAIPATLNAAILEPLYSTVKILLDVHKISAIGPGLWWWNTITLWIIFLGVLSVLFYFYFSIEHKGIVGKLGNVGIWFIMISFGASFWIHGHGPLSL